MGWSCFCFRPLYEAGGEQAAPGEIRTAAIDGEPAPVGPGGEVVLRHLPATVRLRS